MARQKEPLCDIKRVFVLMLKAVTIAAISSAFIWFIRMKYTAPNVCISLGGSGRCIVGNGAVLSLYQPKTYCTTDYCRRTAEQITDGMNMAVDPCSDFYEHACGDWNRRHDVEKTMTNRMLRLKRKVARQLKDVLEKPLSKEDGQTEKKAKQLYKSCINTELIERRQATPMLELIRRLGGWPVLEAAWTGSRFSLERLVANSTLLHVNALVTTTVLPDPHNTGSHMLQIREGNFGMPSRSFYVARASSPQLDAYRQLAVHSAKLLGANSGDAEKQMKEMVEFETQLARITTGISENRCHTRHYRKYKISRIRADSKLASLDWLKYMQGVFSESDVTISPSDHVLLCVPSYFRRLTEVIKKFSARTIANYVIWRIVLSNMKELSEPFTRAIADYHEVLYGLPTIQDRGLVCGLHITKVMGMALGRMYDQHYFKEKTKRNINAMMDDLVVSFQELISNLTWLDTDTKAFTRYTAGSVVRAIGLPEFLKNDAYMQRLYKKIAGDPIRYFENSISNKRWKVNAMLNILRDKPQLDRWISSPLQANAYYETLPNRIELPAAILQEPFYDDRNARSVNFGGIGTIIAHEISHTFLNKGGRYKGAKQTYVGWTDIAVDNMRNCALCMISRYKNFSKLYTDVSLNVNQLFVGKVTFHEDVADNIGLKTSYLAYKKWLNAHEHHEIRLPHLHLTNEQIFFVSFAQNWCGKSREGIGGSNSNLPLHSPYKLRVNGAVSNSPEFADAFRCPVDSPMNPRVKCSYWR